MPTTDNLEDAQLALRLAFHRWGQGYDGRPLCPTCPDRTLWHRRGRVRVFGCTGCGQEYSVTAGTHLHATKLTLTQVQRFVEAHAEPVPPSARALARATGHAPSTAWSLSMRIKSAVAAHAPRLHGLVWSVTRPLPVRPPHPKSPEAHPMAHLDAIESCNDHALAYVTAVSDALGNTTFVPASSPDGASHRLQNASVWAVEDDHNLALLLRATRLVLEVHRTVSERWLPRYLGFVAQVSRIEDLWLALVQPAPRCFRDLRPAAQPPHVYDGRLLPTHRTNADIEELCDDLRFGRPIRLDQIALRRRLLPAELCPAGDRFEPTLRRRTRVARSSRGASA